MEAERIDGLVAALRDAVTAVAAFDATVHGLGAFPAPTRPRVIWAGVRGGADAMREVADRVDAALAPLGLPRETRPFSPHVTLGRVRVPPRDPRLAGALAAAAGREFGRLHVAQVALMQSRLSPRGVAYTELAAARLR